MNQQHIYLDRPDITERSTRIIATRRQGITLAVAVEENLHRAAGGGEPADRGCVAVDGQASWPIVRIDKGDGKTWLVVEAPGQEPPAAGAPVLVSVDPAFRTAKRRLHTLEHITNATVLQHLPGLVITQTGIEDDARAAVISAIAPNPVREGDVEKIDREIRSIVLEGHVVRFARATSVDAARKAYGSLFRVNDRHSLSGKVRLVIIEGVDVNPCSGCHYDSSDVGPYRLTGVLDPSRPEHLRIRLESTETWQYWYGDRAECPADQSSLAPSPDDGFGDKPDARNLAFGANR
jgi:Ser-tRNA(Ala) deacylase AlaX